MSAARPFPQMVEVMSDPQTTPEEIVKKLEEEEDRFERIAGDLPGNAYALGCADGAHWQTAAIKGLLSGTANVHADFGLQTGNNPQEIEPKYQIQIHAGNQKLARVTNLNIKSLPECEGGGWGNFIPTEKL